MELTQHPDIAQQQSLHLTTELQQGIAILQLSATDLIEYVNSHVEENPVLVDATNLAAKSMTTRARPDETTFDSPHEKISFSTADANRTAYSHIGNRPALISADALIEARGRGNPATFDHERRDLSQRAFSIDRFLVIHETLAEHVMSQLRMQTDDATMLAIGEYIMGSLDSSGYLVHSVDEIASLADVNVDAVESVLGCIQGLHPLGIAARNLAECLRPQLEAAGLMSDTLELLLSGHLSDLETKSVGRVARDMGIAVEELELALDDIRSCNPRPGMQFNDTATSIWPEAVIEPEGDGQYAVRMNDPFLPELEIDKNYLTLAETTRDQDTKKYLKDRIREAEGLISGIAYRKATLYKVARCIADTQTEFFEQGFNHLRPLTMSQVAKAIGVSQSTVSRVAKGNYVQTPRGTFEIRFFFHGGVQADGSAEISSISVKRRIQEIVDSENRQQPLSDQAIATILLDEGAQVSRRTVAKYRAQLGIPVRAARRRTENS